MACSDQAVMDQETQYFDALRAADSFELSGNQLTIHYENGQNALNFAKSTAVTPAPSSTSVPLSTPTPTTIVNPTATQRNTSAPERIEFAPGATSATVTGQLTASGSKEYVLRALGGQTMSGDMTFSDGKAILSVWGEDGQVLLTDHAEVSSFRRELPKTQDYYVLVEGRPEGPTAYSMTVAISSLASSPERIEFAPGTTVATVSGNLGASGSDQYVLRALDGQTMNIDLNFAEGKAILVVWGADGQVLLSDHPEASSFRGTLPITQDYYIMVKGSPDGSTSYIMTVTISPLSSS